MKSNGPQKGTKFHQGLFKPKNPEKYVGDVTKIIHRSGLEKRFFKYFDEEPTIIKWASEEFHIHYISPIDQRQHRYFVDNILMMKDGRRIVVEIKPYSQCMPPKKPKTNNRKSQINYAQASMTYSINEAKWKAAAKFCRDRGMEFCILTERNLPKSLRDGRI